MIIVLKKESTKCLNYHPNYSLVVYTTKLKIWTVQFEQPNKVQINSGQTNEISNILNNIIELFRIFLKILIGLKNAI